MDDPRASPGPDDFKRLFSEFFEMQQRVGAQTAANSLIARAEIHALVASLEQLASDIEATGVETRSVRECFERVRKEMIERAVLEIGDTQPETAEFLQRALKEFGESV